MVQCAIDAVQEEGQYQAIKYLFEMIGLYPAAAGSEDVKPDSLTEIFYSAWAWKVESYKAKTQLKARPGNKQAPTTVPYNWKQRPKAATRDISRGIVATDGILSSRKLLRRKQLSGMKRREAPGMDMTWITARIALGGRNLEPGKYGGGCPHWCDPHY